MVENIPVAGTFSLANTNEDVKDRILFALQVSVKQIQHCSSLQCEEDTLDFDTREVRQLCESLDKALFHGLKHCDGGYWSFVTNFTHKSTIQYVERFANVRTDVQKGRAWLSLALGESSLESYFRSFSQNLSLVKRHYKSLAFLCDAQRMQLALMLMAGLEYVPISLSAEKVDYGNGLAFFENHSLSQTSSILGDLQDTCKTPRTSFTESYCEVLPVCNSAIEVTSDFKAPSKTAPTQSSTISEKVSESHKLDSCNSAILNPVSPNELELISKFLNMETKEDDKSSGELEVVRTKVVRRIKRSSSQKTTPENSDSRVSSSDSAENRLSKTTTDSGLCLEVSDSDSTDCTDNTECSDDGQKVSFHVGGTSVQREFLVTFQAPKRSPPERKTSSAKSDDGNSSIGEREAPEGQEDPIEETCYKSDANINRPPVQDCCDDKNSSDEIDDEEELSIYDLHKGYDFCAKAESISLDNTIQIDSSQESTPIKRARWQEGDIVAEEMAKLAMEKQERYDLSVGNNILLYFLVEVYEYEEESFYKLFCGYSNFLEGSDQRVYCLLSNKSIYFLKSGNNQQKFIKAASERYSSIDYVMADLNYQSFKIVSINKSCFSLYTGNEELTRDIVSHLEVAMRRFIPKLPLPSVYTDANNQTSVLSKFLAPHLNCDKSQVSLIHYALCHWEDYTSCHSVTPSGPVYQDYLMYRHKFVKENKATPWKPAFFLLKGGVLYCMEEEKSKPLFFVQMCSPHCRGCRRIHLLNRPHAFEIIRSDNDSLQLAASDTYEASKWLQCFLESVSMAGHFIDSETNIQRPCAIVIANNMVLTLVEDPRKHQYRLLNKANIHDLVTVYTDSVTDTFLMLEFEIAEASKSNGEWIVYFEAAEEKDKFLSILSQKWTEIFQVCLSVEHIQDLFLLKKCRQVSSEFKAEKVALQEFCRDN